MSDLDLLRKLIEVDALYARPDKPRAQVLVEAEALIGEDNLWLIHWALAGQRSGLEWCACALCGELRLMSPTGLKDKPAAKYTDDPPAAQPYCKMTPGCPGNMVRLSKRPVLTKRVREALSQ